MTLRIVLDVLALALLIRAPFDKCVRFYLGLFVGFTIVTFAFPFMTPPSPRVSESTAHHL